MEKRMKRFAVLLCCEDTEYVRNAYGGYFGVFVALLGEEGDRWDLYRASNGELPGDEEIGDYDGFVVSGSCSDAFGEDGWICRLVDFVKKLVKMEKKVMGVCFGHQVLARAVGGKVNRAISGWDLGVTSINFSLSTKLSEDAKTPARLLLIECHRDEVRELPPEAEVLAWSDKTGIEMFRYGDHVMGIQGHPEYTKDILLHLIDRLLRKNLIGESLAHEARLNIEGQEPDRAAWKKICTDFLKNR